MKTLTDDKSALTRAEQGRKTISTLSREISNAFAEFENSTGEILDLALSVENRRIKIGSLLRAAKDALPHGQFTKFIEDNLPFSERQARRFLQHAKAASFKPLESLDAMRDYHGLLVSWGLREPATGHGVQQIHDQPNFFARTVKTLGSVRKSFDELFEHRPLTEWSEEEKAQLREQLRPVAEVYNRL